jgi:hypothetical protein
VNELASALRKTRSLSVEQGTEFPGHAAVAVASPAETAAELADPHDLASF